jgi:hypothetical protein
MTTKRPNTPTGYFASPVEDINEGVVIQSAYLRLAGLAWQQIAAQLRWKANRSTG